METVPMNEPINYPEVPASTSSSSPTTTAGADYFLQITSLPEHRNIELNKKLEKIIRPEIINLNRLLCIHPTLANLEKDSIQMLRMSFDKKVLMAIMFLDRSSMTSVEYDFIEELKCQYYLMLTRSFGNDRERLTQGKTTTVSLVGQSDASKKPENGLYNWITGGK